MKAVRLLEDAHGPGLALSDAPKPSASPGEILVRVAAAGVTPDELSWYASTHNRDGSPRRGAIPGHEFSGFVEALGAGVTEYTVGEAIYGLNDWFAEGATAEFCLTRPESVARKPRRLTHVEAAAVPLAALTAWQGLFDRARLVAGERVLVHGGAGAVGAFVIQIAKLHGAEVVATATGAGLDYARALKADVVLDYKTEAFDEMLSHIDVLFDTVGGDTLARSWPVLQPAGRAVTVAALSPDQPDVRAEQAFFLVEPNHRQLENIALLIDGGALRAFAGAAVPLDDAPAAYAGRVPRPAGYGKVVIEIDAPDA